MVKAKYVLIEDGSSAFFKFIVGGLNVNSAGVALFVVFNSSFKIGED